MHTVLDTLLRMGLGRFVRVKNEPNKEAMLNEPEAARIAGISIVTGVEDFIVTPFEAVAEVQQAPSSSARPPWDTRRPTSAQVAATAGTALRCLLTMPPPLRGRAGSVTGTASV